MDVKREGVGKRKMIRRIIYMTFTLVAVVLVGWRVSLMKPAVPAVEAATIWPDTVKRGPMVRDVRGLGTLVPEDILWFQAAFDSQVSRILARSGDDVKPNTVLLVLTNPQMEVHDGHGRALVVYTAGGEEEGRLLIAQQTCRRAVLVGEGLAGSCNLINPELEYGGNREVVHGNADHIFVRAFELCDELAGEGEELLLTR